MLVRSGPSLPPAAICAKWAKGRALASNCRRTGAGRSGENAPGYKADLNVIDLASLELSRPTVAADLPSGGKRLHQAATGYALTMLSGVVTYREGSATGALPGRLVRGARQPSTH